MWTYQAQPKRVVDGDTIEVTVDMGFQIRRDITLRLAGVDTAEIHFVDQDTDEYRRGQTHRDFVVDWLPDDGDWPLLVETEKSGKYGRYLATVTRQADDAVLNDDLIETFGDSVVYD